MSLLESQNDSGSENSLSSGSLTEEKQQHRYKKRSGSKRAETITDTNNSNNKENLEGRRIRTGSKNSSNRLSLTVVQNNAAEEDECSLHQIHHSPSTQTLQMNSKDIYSGTWNPKERAVLDQVLDNMGGKADTKKSFIGKFRWGHKSNSKAKEKSINKIEEVTEEESLYDKPRDLGYPLNQYLSSDDNQKQQQKKTHKLGLFKKLKETVKQRHEEAYIDKQLQRYGVAPSPNQKKKGLLGRLTPSTKRKEGGAGRSRAHSSNDYTRCVGVYLQPEDSESEISKETTIENKSSNLAKSKSGSFKNLFSSSRAKSVENLNGAFEYYANSKKVFQRTPSMSKLNSRAASMEKIDQMKRSGSQKSLDSHAFEPVKYTAKELCYEDPLVYAQARFMSAQKAHQQRSTHIARQASSDGYCSSPYEDDYYRGYQSDQSHAMPPGYRHFNFDIPPPPPPHQQSANSDSERSHSSMSGYPGYYLPLPPRHVPSNGGYYPSPHPPPPQCQSTPLMSPYFLPAQHVPPMPGYYTPGYATPGAIYATPSGMQSGYTSEGDYSYLPYSPHFRPPPPVNHGYPFVMVPHQSRKAVQRSISKNSSASNHSGNYGYGSESSYCEDDIYSMVHPPQTKNSGPHEQYSNSGRESKTSQLSTDV